MKVAEIILLTAVITLQVITILSELSPYYLGASLTIASMFYFFAAIPIFNSLSYSKLFEQKKMSKAYRTKLFFSGISGVFLSFALIMLVFKLVNWPGGNQLIYYIIILGVLSVFSVFKIAKTNEGTYKKALIRLLAVIILGLYYIIWF